LGEVLASRSPDQVIQIRQGYVIVAGEAGNLRLRHSIAIRDGLETESFLMTIKRGNPPAREEVEVPLTEDQWSALWPLTAGRRIRKERSCVTLPEITSGETVEIDCFPGTNGNWYMIEVEFSGEAEERGFSPPAWFGVEVTGDPRFGNSNLAQQSEGAAPPAPAAPPDPPVHPSPPKTSVSAAGDDAARVL
jgi:adenylate cyclase